MIISVEDEFSDLYNDLKSMGYNVYKFSERIISDVVVYSGKSTHITSLNTYEFNTNDKGIFLINGDYKSTDQILNMIKHKTYSSLF